MRSSLEAVDAALSDLVYLRTTTKVNGKPFTWEKINYHVPVAGGTRRLLHDVFGYVKPGTMTALMGASGAGMYITSL